MMRRALITLLLVACAAICPRELFGQERRVALVIGNAAYKNVNTLRNPSNDAEDIAAALRELGFDVIAGLNLDYEGMRHAVLEFSQKMEGADVGLLYYAGHGIQVSEQNYLVPVDARLSHVRDIDLQLMELEKVFAQMERETNTRIIILDACRDNPFAKTMVNPPSGRQRRVIGRGLSEISGLAGTFVAFATRPGQFALDGDGRNSPFTQALKAHIRRPDTSISDMMTDVRNDVVSVTHSGQIPWEMSSLTSPFFFKQSAPQVTAGHQGATPDDIAARPFWEHVKAKNSIEGYRLFIGVFPNSSFAKDARSAIERLEQNSQQNVGADRAPGRPLTRTLQPSVAARSTEEADRRSDESPSGKVAEIGPSKSFRDCDGCPLMVPIEAGSFLMGSAPTEDGRQKNEGPQREVRVTRPFAVSVYEVTIAEYDACVQAKKCRVVPGKTTSPSPALNAYLDQQRPVANVSWEDARDYAIWLSLQTGWQYQLLSEAEWEYVARAGSSTRFNWGNSATSANVHCTDCGGQDGRKYSTVVGQHAPNAFGLHDVHGNLWEWVADCWHHTYSNAEFSHWPWLEKDGGDCSRRVLRGGSWANTATQLRSAYRLAGKTSSRGELVGFRVARVDPKQERLLRFLEQTYLAGPLSPNDLRAHYCDRVDYYGTAGVSLSKVMDGKARYYRRWPYRSFVIIPGTLQIKEGAGDDLDIYFRYNFRISRTPFTTADTRPGPGRGEVRLKLRMTDQTIRICGENGKTLASSN